MSDEDDNKKQEPEQPSQFPSELFKNLFNPENIRASGLPEIEVLKAERVGIAKQVEAMQKAFEVSSDGLMATATNQPGAKNVFEWAAFCALQARIAGNYLAFIRKHL
jgi:hypothetical protein